MTKTTVSAFAALASAFIGRAVLATDKTGDESRFTIARLSDKIGTLKDGSKGEYLVLTKDGESAVVMNIHPQSAKRLLTKGEESGMKLVEAEAALSTDEQAEVQAELAAEVAPAVEPEAAAPAKKAKKVKAEPEVPAVAEDKAPSKKALTVAMYKEMTAAGKPRKDIIARMKSELNLSAPGANTYYQNCKGGRWE